jgi:hypothetical protein
MCKDDNGCPKQVVAYGKNPNSRAKKNILLKLPRNENISDDAAKQQNIVSNKKIVCRHLVLRYVEVFVCTRCGNSSFWCSVDKSEL